MKHPRRLNSYWSLTLTSLTLVCSVPLRLQGQASPSFVLSSDDAKEAHAYKLLFRQSATYNRLADQADADGEPKPYLRRLMADRLRLDDDGAASLLRLALAYQAEINPIHRQIEDLKSSYLAKFPMGIKYPGMSVVQPPEIGELKAHENTIVIRYRDLLRNELGEEVFQQVDGALKSTLVGSGSFTMEQ